MSTSLDPTPGLRLGYLLRRAYKSDETKESGPSCNFDEASSA